MYETDSGMKRIFPVGYDKGFGDEADIPGQGSDIGISVSSSYPLSYSRSRASPKSVIIRIIQNFAQTFSGRN